MSYGLFCEVGLPGLKVTVPHENLQRSCEVPATGDPLRLRLPWFFHIPSPLLSDILNRLSESFREALLPLKRTRHLAALCG